MILAVNIGNTNINFGLFNINAFERYHRVNIDEFLHNKNGIKHFFDQINIATIQGIIIASVNPDIEDIFCCWLKDVYNKTYVRIGKEIEPQITMKVKSPKKVGVDRVLNSVAAYEIEKKSVIVVDIGTATTFDVVSDTGEYLGGVISPGIKMCAEALKTKTAQLPLVTIKKPISALGKDTNEAITSGVYWGNIGSIKFILEKLFEELKYKPIVIATGGDAELIHNSVGYISKIVPHLTLDGIKAVYTSNSHKFSQT